MKTLTLLALSSLLALTACASSTTSSDEVDSMDVAFTDASVTVTNDEVASPRKKLDASLGNIEITVDYGSPLAKGRELWGGLVPYDAIWRTGANEATNLETSGDLLVEGELLPAGHYSMFTIPTAGEWTVVFNGQPAQWGAYNHDPALDVLRVTATPIESEMSESMEFDASGNTLSLHWGTLALPIQIEPAR